MTKMVLPDGGPVKLIKGKITPFNPYPEKPSEEGKEITLTATGKLFKKPEELISELKEKLPKGVKVLHATHRIIADKTTKGYQREVSLTYEKPKEKEVKENGD